MTVLIHPFTGRPYDAVPGPFGPIAVYADMDFETYCEAGYEWDDVKNKWSKLGTKGGIADVGAWTYSMHPSCEPISLAYNLKDGTGPKQWRYGDPRPEDLIRYIEMGGIIEAHNSFFEYAIWINVWHKRFGFPAIKIEQLRCSASKAQAYGLPRKLSAIGEALQLQVVKDTLGGSVSKQLWMPRTPTKADPRKRIKPTDDPALYQTNCTYNAQDIIAEAAISAAIPDLNPFEQQMFILDQKINARGVGVDMENLENAIAIYHQAVARYTPELQSLTSGSVLTANSHQKLKAWLHARGCLVPDTAADTVDEWVDKYGLDSDVKRVLEIRQMLGSASIAKLFSMRNFASGDGRLHGAFIYCGAERTGRWAGSGPQPHNFPRSGPKVDGNEWDENYALECIALLQTRSLDVIEHRFGNAMKAISGCLRGFIMAAPGHEFINADYSAIEARGLAMLAGEEWRIDVFRTHGKIYEASAGQMYGMSMEDFKTYKNEHGGHHHPYRQHGKTAELALGYGGGVASLVAFGADKFMSESEMDQTVKNWRAKSPKVRDFWYGLEHAASSAIQQPGSTFQYNGIMYQMKNGNLYCRLPSGRILTYHRAGLELKGTWRGQPSYQMYYYGMPEKARAAPRWQRIDTWGGKLCNNVVQGTCRDLLAHALVRLDPKYPIVMHVHDEAMAEVPIGYGAVEEFEEIMGQLPDWAKDWPVKAAGGWRGPRFRK